MFCDKIKVIIIYGAILLIPTIFLASKKVYALDPQGIIFNEEKKVDPAGVAYTMRSYQIPAVWFSRRSNGRKAAFFGVLWDHERTNDEDGVAAVWDLDAFLTNCKYRTLWWYSVWLLGWSSSLVGRCCLLK